MAKLTHVDDNVVVYNTVLHDLRKLLLGNTKRGVHFIQRIRKVALVDTQMFDIVGDAGYRADLDVTIERKTSRALYETSDLGTRKVLG